ncbi:hypothetical protein DL764_001475 [Monosporascus ibericus]|uniref:Mitochondrial outer membrane transport complex Sam37/metaxin N-terminal domain-containing protein n=1 Tax=Monosporascus ibericus TaxID=155417 RepID=A0A4Q4TQZ8_9PEZI|nr:hypothetical protein DL764_001475 [Monosporascus ibericus]
MVFELHVWGPAFGLSSIDPDCLAAIAYFAYVVPREDWILSASNDVSVCPDHILPALKHGGIWTSGYANVVSYLAKHHASRSLDDDLTPLQRADSLACASFLATRGSALLAMSLYVSPATWAKLTRPAYSSLLPFPLTWTVPLAIRAAAIEKVEHLGLGHLAAEVDNADLSTGTPAVTRTSTGFIRLPARLGPSSTLQPEQASAIRLQSLAGDFFSVLDELRGEKRFLLRDGQPCSLDFLAYGYLKLMQVQTPYPFLDSVMRKSHGRLVGFVDEVHSSLPSAPGDGAGGVEDPPWQSLVPAGAVGVLGRFADGVLESIPSAGDSWRRWRRGGVRDRADDKVKDPNQLVLTAGKALLGLAALGGGLLFRSLSPFGADTHRFEPEKQDQTGLLRFGEVGAMLQALSVFPPSSDTLYHTGNVDATVEVQPSAIAPPV